MQLKDTIEKSINSASKTKTMLSPNSSIFAAHSYEGGARYKCIISV